MSLLSETIWLLSKELKQELRQKAAVNGILLQVASTVFLAYLAFVAVSAPAWNALFWVILLFSAIQAASRSFLQETPGRLLYIYQLASPTAVILSKILYNTMLIIVLSVLCFTLYVILIGNQAQEIWYYLAIILLCSIGFSGVFTLISALAAKAGNGGMLMPILSFPVLLPLMLVGIKASKSAMDGIVAEGYMKDVVVLGLMDILVISLALILFKYLWRD